MCPHALLRRAQMPEQTGSDQRVDMTSREKHDRMANAIRILSLEAVAKSNSGHPSLPLGAGNSATVRYTRFRKHVPQKPKWADRDPFVLSAAHSSMLLYSLLYLSGNEDIKSDEI